MSDPVKPTPAIVLVRWLDSSSQHGWLSEDEISKEPVLCETLGFLVKESADHIVVALNRGLSENIQPWGEVISIPMVAVKFRMDFPHPTHAVE